MRTRKSCQSRAAKKRSRRTRAWARMQKAFESDEAEFQNSERAGQRSCAVDPAGPEGETVAREQQRTGFQTSRPAENC